jgi:hypothetical protein
VGEAKKEKNYLKIETMLESVHGCIKTPVGKATAGKFEGNLTKRYFPNKGQALRYPPFLFLRSIVPVQDPNR